MKFKTLFISSEEKHGQKEATNQKVLYFQEVGQKRKMVIKIEFTPLSLSRLQNLSL